MDLGASAIVLRPRTVAETMDLACRFTFIRGLWLYTKLSALFVLPFYAVTLGLTYLTDIDWYWVWAIAIPVATWLEAPFSLAASRMMFGETPTAGSVLKQFWGRFGAYAVGMFLKFLYIGLGGLLCGIGALLVAPSGVLVPEAILLEGAGGGESWGRSRRLVAQRSSDTFMAMLALMLSVFAFILSIEAFGQFLLAFILQLGEPFGGLFDKGVTPFALAGLFLAAPFTATARFLHYIDTRTRADGWDIQVKFMALVAEHEANKALKAGAS